MNLYDRIKPGKRRRGWGGAVFLAAACVVLVICIGTIGWAARYHQRYRRFSTDFAASVAGSERLDGPDAADGSGAARCAPRFAGCRYPGAQRRREADHP